MNSLSNPYAHRPISSALSTAGAPGDRWLRGNIHTHTTASDGRQEPQEVVDWYTERGYDFLIITDHNLVLPVENLDSHGMLLVRGEELTARSSHVLGLGIEETLPAGTGLQEQIDLVKSAGGLSVVCHPNWMGLTVDQIAPLQGHLAVELSNQVCYRLNGKGNSVAWWDELLTHGHRCWGVAVDDCHDLPQDACAGWLLVDAQERTWSAIRAALERGSFVASTGPRFERIKVDGRTLAVETSACTAIQVVGSAGRILSEWQASADEPLTRAAFEVAEREPFARIEITDAQGHTAWSQPFWTEGT